MWDYFKRISGIRRTLPVSKGSRATILLPYNFIPPTSEVYFPFVGSPRSTKYPIYGIGASPSRSDSLRWLHGKRFLTSPFSSGGKVIPILNVTESNFFISKCMARSMASRKSLSKFQDSTIRSYPKLGVKLIRIVLSPTLLASPIDMDVEIKSKK